jgi:pyruvate-formate lyase
MKREKTMNKNVSNKSFELYIDKPNVERFTEVVLDGKAINMKTILELNPRLKRLADRSKELSESGRRTIYLPDSEFLVFRHSEVCSTTVPATGEYSIPTYERIPMGNHHMRVDVGKPFPKESEVPSRVKGYECSPENWAEDYAFLLDNHPAEVYHDEHIVGEYHWELNEIRMFKYPDEVLELAKKAREFGTGGASGSHTCPDLSIGLKLGWGGILEKIRKNKQKYEKYYNKNKVSYLNASEIVCESIMRFIQKYSDKAKELSENEIDTEKKSIYRKVAQTCEYISSKPPKSFLEAVQWIYFYTLVNEMQGHGTVFGRIDQLLIDFYRNDISNEVITSDKARELLAELFLKYSGNYFGLSGRNSELCDATNEVSWLALEAYDMIFKYSHLWENLGVMWHSDMDENFYSYACDVLGRTGCGCPILVNYDLMRASEIRSGVSEEDSWNLSYGGCQWYSTVGNEYCDHDLNIIVIIKPMQRAIDIAVEKNVQDFEDLFRIFKDEFYKTALALRDLKNKTYEWQHKIQPEIVTSFCMYGPIEKGMDVTHPGAVNNEYTSSDLLGVPNVVDSLYAIKKVIFEEKQYTLRELRDAVAQNWKNNEVMRQKILNQEKFGNDLDDVDAMFVKVTDMIVDTFDNLINLKGANFRASLYEFLGYAYAGPILGATPDGRYAEEPIAHGSNPMVGRAINGLTAAANSLVKCGFDKFLGGTMQVELQPKFLNGKNDIGTYIENFSKAFMKTGGMQIVLNVMDLKKLEGAVDHPENPEYQDIVVKVTGYSTYFVLMGREFRKEFVKRINYGVS